MGKHLLLLFTFSLLKVEHLFDSSLKLSRIVT